MYTPAKLEMTDELDKNIFREEYMKLGKIGYEEKVILGAFILLACLWLFRKNIELGFMTIPGWSNLMSDPGFIDDGTVAIFVAMLLFLIPSHSEGKGRLMNWRTARNLPWGIFLLFGAI